MLGVAIAVEEVDHDPLHPGVAQLGQRCPGLVLVEWDRHLAEHVDALAHALDQLARDQRLVVVVGGDVEAVGVRIAQVGLDPALQAQRVLHAAGDDDAHPPTLAFEQPVEHGGAGVDPGHDPGKRRLGLGVPVAQRVAGRGHEAHRLVLGSGLGLAHHELAVAVDHERVGHGPAGVDR